MRALFFFQSDSITDAKTAAGQEQLPVYHFPLMSSPQQHPNADVMKIIIIHVTFVDIIGRWSRDRHASSQQLVDLAQYKTICRYYVVFTRHPMGARGIQTRRRIREAKSTTVPEYSVIFNSKISLILFIHMN